jgi:hypothetical protein
MGRGGTNSLWSSGMTCKVACFTVQTGESKQLNPEEVNLYYFLAGVMHDQSAYAKTHLQ